MSLKVVLLSCFLGILAHGAVASVGDTTHPAKPHNITTIFTESTKIPFNQWQKQPWTVDSTLYNFQDYIPQYTLGNTGLPYVPLIFSTNPNPIGFYYGNNYLGYQLFSDSTIRYYNTRAPYTQFYYVTDPMIHQFFHFLHTQNIGKDFNFALEFHRTRSAGAYVNQGSNINQLTLSINYHTKRYAIFADGIYGTYEIDQNGGIAADSDFSLSVYSDRGTMPVSLLAARSTFTEESFHFRQFLFMGYKGGDSLDKNPLLYLSHTFRIAGNTNIYSDPGPLNFNYYNTAFKNDSVTYDSLHYVELSNDISIGAAKGWLSFLRWEAGVTDQWVHYRDARTDTTMNNLIAHACVYDTGRTLYNLQGKEIVAGTQTGDMQLSACIGQKIDSLQTIRLQGQYSDQTPPLIYELYYGNNFRWENHFNKTTTSSASLIYTNAKWKLSLMLQAEQITNLTYFTVDGTPQQYIPGIPIFSAQLKKDFKVGKWHLNTNNIYQYISQQVPLRFPQFVLENSLFYENMLFHHALQVKIGVDVYYNTAYYGYAYNPVVDQYYVENQEKLGNYIYWDPFISFRIKTFRIFFKLENAGSGLEGNYYFYALRYPMPDRTLRMGISWDFWN